MAKKSFVLIGMAVIFAVGAGCTDLRKVCKGPNTFCPGTSRLEMDHGTSHRLAKFNQTLNPDAEKNLEPVTGFDGKAAQNTIDKHRKDFEKPTPPPTFVFDLQTMGK